MKHDPKPLTSGDVWDWLPDDLEAELSKDFVAIDHEVYFRGDVPRCEDCGEASFDLLSTDEGYGPDVCEACDQERRGEAREARSLHAWASWARGARS